jgi:hypothetical protein
VKANKKKKTPNKKKKKEISFPFSVFPLPNLESSSLSASISIFV